MSAARKYRCDTCGSVEGARPPRKPARVGAVLLWTTVAFIGLLFVIVAGRYGVVGVYVDLNDFADPLTEADMDELYRIAKAEPLFDCAACDTPAKYVPPQGSLVPHRPVECLNCGLVRDSQKYGVRPSG